MSTMKYRLIISLLLVGSWLQAQDTIMSDTLRLDLAMCRKMALESSELVKIAEATIAKAEHQKKAARSAYLPSVKASATGMYNEQDVEKTVSVPTQVFDPSTGALVPNIAMDATGAPIIGPGGVPVFNTYAYLPIDIGMYGGFMAGVTAEQALYAGGKISAGNKMADIGSSMALDNKELKRVETIYEADQSYFVYMAVQEKVLLAKAYHSLLLQLYQSVSDSYEAGMASYNDVLKVKVELNAVVLDVHKAESGLSLARMSLCRVLGLPFGTPISVGSLAVDNSSMAIAAQDIDVTKRVEYQVMDKQVKMAEQKVKMTKGDYMPTAGVSVGYNYFNIDVKNADNFDNAGLTLAARVEIPITTFGERKGKVMAEKSDLRIKQLELQRASDLLTLEVEQARFNLLDAQLRVDLSRESLEQADENRRVSEDSYELGMTTLVDFLEAQASWQKAYSEKIDADVDYKLKSSHFLKVSNKL